MGRWPGGSVANLVGFVNDLVAEFFNIERALDGAQDNHIALVLVVAAAGQKAIAAHCVQCTGDGRLGDPELRRKASHRMRRRFHIDCEKHHHLPCREVAFIFQHHIMGHVVP